MRPPLRNFIPVLRELVIPYTRVLVDHRDIPLPPKFGISTFERRNPCHALPALWYPIPNFRDDLNRRSAQCANVSSTCRNPILFAFRNSPTGALLSETKRRWKTFSGESESLSRRRESWEVFLQGTLAGIR